MKEKKQGSKYIPLPKDFIERMEKKLGADAPGFFDSLETSSPVVIRFNPRKRVEEKGMFHINESVPWSKEAIYLKERPVFAHDPLFHMGAYYVQEPSSMIVEQVWHHVRPMLSEHPIVLDSCAAPGGKTTHLLSLMDGRGVLVANEVDALRNKVLVENLTKWGYANVIATKSDTKWFSGLPGMFDVICVDAPCSGEGMFRKDMFAREQWSLKLVDQCAKTQKIILENLIGTLKVGGFLMYSTCTFSKEENEDIADFLLSICEGEIVPLQECVQDFGVVEEVSEGKNPIYRMYPDKVSGEGLSFFLFHKIGGPLQKERKQSNFPLKAVSGFAYQDVCTIPAGERLYLHEKDLYHISDLKKDVLNKIHTELRISWISGKIGTVFGEELKLSHEALMSTELDFPDLPKLEMERDIALEIIRRNHISLDIPDGKYIATYKEMSLTLLTKTNGKVHTLWPMEYRLRR